MRREVIGNCELYLGDCMELMATMPDKSIDLAIVDPPYGGGGTLPPQLQVNPSRFGARFDRYRNFKKKTNHATGGGFRKYDVAELGGDGRAGMGATSMTGILRRVKIISRNCFEFHDSRLFGEAIISTCRPAGILLYGES